MNESLFAAARDGRFDHVREILETELKTAKYRQLVLNQMDRNLRSVAHYAADVDNVPFLQWLREAGADLLARDANNVTPVAISVRRVNLGQANESVLSFWRGILNPIQQMFLIDDATSTKSVRGVDDLRSLSDEELEERFPIHNDMQASHLFVIHGRMEELKYLASRRVWLLAEDAYGNGLMHFSSTAEMARFVAHECKLGPGDTRLADDFTPAHNLIDQIHRGTMSDEEGAEILKILIQAGDDLRLRGGRGNGTALELGKRLLKEGKTLDVLLNHHKYLPLPEPLSPWEKYGSPWPFEPMRFLFNPL